MRQENLIKHGEVIGFLKETHGLTHGFANLVAHKAKGSDSDSVENKDELITQQYQGKLEAVTTSNTMCSHKINLTGVNDMDGGVIEWIKTAYEHAG